MELKKRHAAASAVVIACCVAAVGNFEGTKHLPYRDMGGVWTVCRGHTGPDVIPGVAWTDDQCKRQDMVDVLKAAAQVNGCINVALPQGAQIAYNDFAYNVGGTAFCRSSMARLENQGLHREACAGLLRYVYVGKVDCRTAGTRCPGIVKRRQWEYAKCAG